jgi:hypothetical protein
MATLTGQLFIGEQGISTAESFRALDPTLGQPLEPAGHPRDRRRCQLVAHQR